MYDKVGLLGLEACRKVGRGIIGAGDGNLCLMVGGGQKAIERRRTETSEVQGEHR